MNKPLDAHDWLELGVSSDDRASFMCRTCELRVSAPRPGSFARVTAAGASGAAYPTEASPTPEELVRGGCPGECHLRTVRTVHDR